MMRAAFAILAALCLHPPLEEGGDCVCQKAVLTNGWCGHCRVGYAAGLKVPSALLFEAMDTYGHDIDAPTIQCKTCQKALGSEGYCDGCGFGFVRGKAYASKLTYLLAKGMGAEPAAEKCESCKANARRFGWCESCKVGMVGSSAFRDRALYAAAVVEYHRLVAAIAKLPECEICAIALYRRSRCPKCNISFRDDKELPEDAAESEKADAGEASSE